MFILHDDGRVFDYELDHLRNQLALYDQRYRSNFESLQSGAVWEVEHAMDQMEYIVGSAFVECQTYITSTFGPIRDMDRRKAVAVGREITQDLTPAALINHAANYWKHKDEWPDPTNWKPREWTINDAFGAIGIDLFEPSGLVVHRVFERIIGDSPPSITVLGDVLMEWRDALLDLRYNAPKPTTN